MLAAPLPCLAQDYVPNPDTAANRQDNTMSTRPDENSGQAIIGTDPATGDQVMEAVPPPPQEEDQPQLNLDNMEIYPVVPFQPRRGRR